MQRGPLVTIALVIRDFEKLEQFRRDQAGAVAARANRGDVLRQCQGLMRDVQPEHRHIRAARENDVRGVRIAEDVELGGWGPIAQFRTAAHQHDFLNQWHDSRLEAHRRRHVGHRSDWAERDFVRVVQYALDDEVSRSSRLSPATRQRQGWPLETAFAMHELRADAVTHQRQRRATVHGQV